MKTAAYVISAAAGCLLALSAAASSAASEPLHVGVMENVKPTDKQTIIDATVDRLKKEFYPREVEVRTLSMKEIQADILDGKIDLFISSAGHSYRFQRAYGVRVLGSIVTPEFPDPNRVDAAAVVVRVSDEKITELSDLKGKRLTVNAKSSYSGFQIPMGEVAKLTSDWDHYFSSVTETGGGPALEKAFDQLIAGKTDAAFAKVCFLETWESFYPEKKGLLKVIGRKDSGTESCRYSTELYPSWTVTATGRMTPEDVRKAMVAVIGMAPDENGNYWGVATDFLHIDRLFQRLRIGPYAYMREWTVRRVLTEYWHVFALILLTVMGLIAHARRSDILVKRRTAELKDLMQKQAALQKAERAASEHLESLQKMGALGQISGMLAHEMRQPLAAISFYLQGLQILLSRGVIGPKEKLETPFAEIEKQTKKADDIVEHVRYYAKNSKNGSRREEMDLAEVIRKTAGNYRVSRRDAPEVHLNLAEGVSVHADPLEIECVIFNLLKNAGEAQEGREHREISAELSVTGELAFVKVTNPGDVLDDAVFEKLVTPSESTKENGLGLGISIVRSLLESYGGRLVYRRLETGGVEALFTLSCMQKKISEELPS